MGFEVPQELATSHGGPDFFRVGARFAETHELWGGLKGHHSVLDIGCGPGRMAIGIGERFGWTNDYVGFDVRRADIDFCQKAITPQKPNFVFHHFDLENSHYNKSGGSAANEVRFPAGDGTIDFVFATSIYTHFFRDEVAHYLRETARVGRGTSLSSWFIIDDLFFERRERGHVRFDFPHVADDGTFIQHEDKPLDVAGHRIETVQEMFDAAGLEITGHHPGGWKAKGLHPIRHSQDVIVAKVK